MDFSLRDQLLEQAVIEDDCAEIKRLVSLDGFDELLLNSALLCSCEYGKLISAKFLLALGANPRTHNDGCVYTACHNGHLDILNFLQHSGVNIHTKNHFCFEKACEKGHLDIVQYYTEHSIEPDTLHAGFHAACVAEHYSVILFLLKQGVTLTDINYSPVTRALSESRFSMCRFLLEQFNDTEIDDCRTLIKDTIFFDKYKKDTFDDLVHTTTLTRSLDRSVACIPESKESTLPSEVHHNSL